MIALHGHHLGRSLDPPLNTHVADAFLMNCRKMYDFFLPPPSAQPDDIKAADFLDAPVSFDLSAFGEWRGAMHKQLMHVSYTRVDNPRSWDGRTESEPFLDQFMRAWKTLRHGLKEPYTSRFETEIAAKLQGEYSGLDLW